jgi:hypothetical protein
MNRLTAAAALAFSAGFAQATPDVICGVLTDTINHGKIGDYRAYSVGTSACNKGDTPANWIANSLNHPVISTSLWKIDNGRMTQLGAAFVKHSFASLQNNECGFGCGAGGGWQALGPGCSDPYGASLNATQSDLGPRFEVNAYAGQYVHPPMFDGQTGNAVFKRLQVLQSEIESTTAQFFVEGFYVTLDDAQAGNQFNNASYRRYIINQTNFNISGSGSTIRETPAIFAWQTHGLGVNVPDPSVTISQIDVPGEGRMFLASKAVDLGNGTWRYEYGMYNYNSHRSVGSIEIPVNTGSSNHGFHDIHYHSGEPLSGTDWAPVDSGDSVTWSTQDYATNINANAIRWGSMYNFWFETDAAPTTGDVTIGLFRPGSPSSVTGSATVPTAQAPCVADFVEPFGVLDFFDVSAFLGAFGQQKPSADIAEPFGSFDFFDISAFLAAFNAGCP